MNATSQPRAQGLRGREDERPWERGWQHRGFRHFHRFYPVFVQFCIYSVIMQRVYNILFIHDFAHRSYDFNEK